MRQVIPLSEAVFCDDCGCVTNSQNGTCGYCCSSALLGLAQALQSNFRSEARLVERIQIAPMMRRLGPAVQS